MAAGRERQPADRRGDEPAEVVLALEGEIRLVARRRHDHALAERGEERRLPVRPGSGSS